MLWTLNICLTAAQDLCVTDGLTYLFGGWVLQGLCVWWWQEVQHHRMNKMLKKLKKNAVKTGMSRNCIDCVLTKEHPPRGGGNLPTVPQKGEERSGYILLYEGRTTHKSRKRRSNQSFRVSWSGCQKVRTAWECTGLDCPRVMWVASCRAVTSAQKAQKKSQTLVQRGKKQTTGGFL